uniref:MARVEL domain-containing protein n=1 Tax=Caenorhabditis japonica TaxID=281687 RepID=A0A8R1E2T5_CAEJA
MSYHEMKQMPGMLKPLLLVLTLLQIIFMASPGLRGWGWFICLTSILEFITAIGVFAAVFFDLLFTKSSQWTLIELAYSAVFCVCSALNTIYYFCNIFYHFNFWFLLATVASVLIVLAYGLQTLVAWTDRTGTVSSSGTGNQATAAAPPQPSPFPAGVNPA